MTTTPAPAFPLTVYYDVSCPLCRAEMEAMKARDAGDVLRLVDCSALSRLPLPRVFRIPAMPSGAACPVDTRAPNAGRDEPC